MDVLAAGDDGEGYAVLQAPTGSNKTGAAAETIWRNVEEEITGGRPVVLFAETCDARDEVANRARDVCGDDGVLRLRGHKELCPTAAGEYDPENIDKKDPDAPEPFFLDGEPAGEWFDERTQGRGIPISSVHAQAEQTARAEGKTLPCEEGDHLCAVKTQWDGGLMVKERVRCDTADHTADECDDCGPIRCNVATHTVAECPEFEPVRCDVATHTVENCDDCYTERERCDDAGSPGHTVDQCPDCHTEHVRCDRHDPDHTTDSCPNCFDARCDLHDPEHTVTDCDSCHDVRCDRHDPDHTTTECGDCFDVTEPRYDLVVATDPFAFVPSLRTETNVIHDEQPDYSEDLGVDREKYPSHAGFIEARNTRLRQAVTAYLSLTNEGPDAFEALVELARECARCDAPYWNEHAPPDERPDGDLTERWKGAFTATTYTPSTGWYFADPRAHTLAPPITKAIWKAITGEVRADRDPDVNGPDGVFDANGRASAAVNHRPPRLDDDAGDKDSWNLTHVTVTIDEENTVRRIRNVPDFRAARSVVGLDARPTPWLWQRNTIPEMDVRRVLDRDEARLWRRYKRRQTVVQVGDATRPAGSEGKYFNERHAREVIDALRDHFGNDFRATGCPSAFEDEIADLMRDAGIDDPATLHYGEEKSRNPDGFADALAGLVYACIDPGDDYVLDLLAECNLDAEPERSEHECAECEGGGCYACDGTGRKRAHGRGFVGPDADHAAELLESVRATHVAQMIGRFGRSLDVANGEANLTFVATDAVPEDLVDYRIPDIQWVRSDTQREILERLDDHGRATARELADGLDCTPEHVRQTLTRYEEAGAVRRQRGAARFGADAWSAAGSGGGGGLGGYQLTLDDVVTIANSRVYATNTYELAIDAVHAEPTTPIAGRAGIGAPDDPDDPPDPPPD